MFCSHISYFYSSLHDREGFISVSNVWFPYSCDQNTNQGLRAFVSLLWFLYMSAANKLILQPLFAFPLKMKQFALKIARVSQLKI